MSLVQVNKTILTSSASTITVTGIDDDSDYIFTVSNMFVSSSSDIKMRFTVGGSADSSSLYYSRQYIMYHDTSHGASIQSATNNIDLSQAVGTTYDNGFAMIGYLYGFNNTSRYATAVYHNSHRNLSLNRFASVKGATMLKETDAKDGIYFYVGGGSANFDSAEVVLYKVST